MISFLLQFLRILLIAVPNQPSVAQFVESKVLAFINLKFTNGVQPSQEERESWALNIGGIATAMYVSNN